MQADTGARYLEITVRYLFLVVLLLSVWRHCLAQGNDFYERATPTEPVRAVLDAFSSHSVVAIGYGGPREEAHAFRVSLIRDPRFAEVVDEVVVYFGNSRYQDTIDRYTRGDDVPYDELKKVWQNTTQPHDGWDRPIYAAFYSEVRLLNASLPADRRIRIVLADPPIDWSEIEAYRDLLPWLQRRFEFFTATVEREAATGQRLLLIGGASFFARSGPEWAPESEMPIERIERASGARAFTIWTTMFETLSDFQEDVTSWPRPSLALVSGTKIGSIEYNILSHDGTPGTLQDHYDAVLYLGAADDLVESKLDPELCSDQEYLAMRLPRLRMAADEGGPGWLEDFERYCASSLMRR